MSVLNIKVKMDLPGKSFDLSQLTYLEAKRVVEI